MKFSLLVQLFLPLVLASYGDRESSFQNCLKKCTFSDCRSSQSGLDWILTLTLWTCQDNCKYHCMHHVTLLFQSHGQPTLQYYGKWPFLRFMGLQEPASVFFSILNGLAHYSGFKKMKQLPSSTEPLKSFYITCGIIGINVWIWSSLYHARDFNLTEKGDYFSAILYLVYLLFLALLRVFELNAFKQRFTLLALFSFFTLHVLYLSLWPFDYTYNMIAGVLLGVSTNSLWLYWWWQKRFTRSYAWKQAILAIGISLAMSFELLDFPPIWGVFDAHSLWHAATPPLILLHYNFLDSDARFEAKRYKSEIGGLL